MIVSMQQISDHEADALIDIIYEKSGIVLSVARKSLMLARLGRRLRQLGIETFSEYIEIIKENKDQEELMCMIDEITTNKTEFFREIHHFEFLEEKLLPALTMQSPGRPLELNVVSVGCSTGEEPYSIAMTIAEYFRTYPGNFSLTCYDICRRTLRHARRAVYNEELIQSIPTKYRKYLMAGKKDYDGQYRIVPELRARMNFEYANITARDFKVPQQSHIVFNRNVMIYFDRKTIAELIAKIQEALVPGGHLFIGHSESLNGLNQSLTNVFPTVYMKPRG